jgi:hypothetical protein
MLALAPMIQVYLAAGHTDLPRSIDGLARLVAGQMDLDPLSPIPHSPGMASPADRYNGSGLRRARRAPSVAGQSSHESKTSCACADPSSPPQPADLSTAASRPSLRPFTAQPASVALLAQRSLFGPPDCASGAATPDPARNEQAIGLLDSKRRESVELILQLDCPGARALASHAPRPRPKRP